jgi:hypothetical protein
MSDEIEAAGAFVTAGLAANALDRPASGDGRHGTACANCSALLTGPFCGQCGQRAHLHRTVTEVFHEFLHGITHFDGKAWKTLPMLVFRPGKLTRSYIEGQRARYVAPVPLFLMVVFLMFFAFSFVSINDNIGGDSATTDGGKPMTQAEAIKELPNAQAELAKLDAQIKAAANSTEPGELAGLQGARIGVAAARDAIAARARGEAARPEDIPGQIAREITDAEKNGKLSINMGAESLNEKARKALKNPELVLYKLQAKAYKLSFLLVPLSLPWLWLAFFWRRNVGMYDHAIFTLYSISFMSLVFVVGSLALTANITSEYLWVPLVLAPGVHMFAQLRGAYGLRWWEAGWRTTYLTLAALITLTLYFATLVVLGVVD